ncbi:unnamed protein product, partial [Adineta ricciae]
NFQHGYEKAMEQDLRPYGIILVKPQNAIGDIYDEETIKTILEYAAEK